MVLIERDGVLHWQTEEDHAGPGTTRHSRRAGRAHWRRGLQGANVLKEVSVPVLEPNEYLRALHDTDRKLNAQCDAGLASVKRLGGGFTCSAEGLRQRYSGRTLVLVHGTFSSSRHFVDELAATDEGRAFLSDALGRYRNQVLVFDHPTLSVSPFLNALDLSRRLAGSTGEIDIVAHSRGGVVVRWWLEALGETVAGANVRAVLVGSPLRGTSLAAPNRIQPLLSVLSNVGSLVSKAAGAAASINPFSMAAFALLKFVARRERNRWGIPPVEDLGSRPSTDAAVAVIPGLHGQAAVSNNFELDRLRKHAPRANVRYHAITANFEPQRAGWNLWQVIREAGPRVGDAFADRIFPAENDLIVDTAHMTSLQDGVDIADVHAFGTQADVHHTNYFRQAATLERLREWLFSGP
jgi:pimeloyl-ACP methyl ester carboxylesterase